jgi:hypothetical protein
VPDIPPASLAAAEYAIIGAATDFGQDNIVAGPSCDLARAALEAAAPILAEHVAQKITAHMESHGPHRPAGALEPVTAIGRDYRAWRRHFAIAARVAAGAFWTDEDKLRLAAEAIGRGEFIACDPEVPDAAT